MAREITDKTTRKGIMTRDMIFRLITAAVIGLIVIGIAIFWFVDVPAERERLAVEALKDVGVVVIGIAVIEFVWALLGGAPTEHGLRRLLSELNITRIDIGSDVDSIRREVTTISLLVASGRRCGLENIGVSQDDLSFDYPDFIASVRAAKEIIQISGASLYFLYANDEALRALVDRAGDGLTVEILLPADDNQILMAIFQDRFEPHLRQTVKDLTKRIADLQSNIRLIRLKRKALTTTIIRVDDVMLVTPYLYSRQTSESPRFLLRNPDSPLFKIYEGEFVALSST